MSALRTSVFLERESYKRRRILDAARLLPLFGVALFLVPLLWPTPDDPIAAAAEPVSMSSSLVYIFGAWAALIAMALLFGVKSRGWGPGQGDPWRRVQAPDDRPDSG